MCLFVNMFIMPIGSFLAQRNFNPRLLLCIGAVVAFPSFFIASLFDGEDQFPYFAIFYIFGFSFNQGMAYMVPIHHCWLWWPKNPGLVSGIILGGFGFGGVIFDNVFTHIVNPTGEKVGDDGFYSDDINDRFIMTWRAVVGMWLVIAAVGISMTFPGPIKAEKRTARIVTDSAEPYSSNNSKLPQKSTAANYSTESSKLFFSEDLNDFQNNNDALAAQELQEDLSRLEVIRDSESKMRMVLSQPFLVVYVMNMLSVITGFFTVNNFKQFAILNDIKDESYLAWVGSAAAIFNSIRFIWSLATDHFSYKLIYGIMLTMQIVLCFTMQLVDD
mmetsp:Transcript_31553/g.41789  ORF Transcript_31553/g.41789 Transcript_31553/m.41789 type:complete len:330 (+) Transcript_31553:296-1285(+)